MAHSDSFPSTRWSLIDRLGSGDEGDRYLTDFLTRYRPALIAFMAVQPGFAPHEAEDFVQGFITDRILQKKLLRSADVSRGRLRNFLMRSLRNYAMNIVRSRRASKRRPDSGLVSLDELQVAAGDRSLPETQFDIEWARSVLSQALERTEQEAEQKALLQHWQVFLRRVIQPSFEGAPVPSYAQLVADHGFATEAEASNRLITIKRMFKKHLHAIISEYVQSPQQAEDEIRDLRSVLAASSSAG